MNGLDDLLDRISEAFGQLWSRIEENSAYNTARENYEALPSSTQKIIKLGSVSVTVLALFFIPISGILGSSSYIDEFNQKRQIIEDLLAAEQSIKKGSPLPPSLSSASMQSKIKGRMQRLRLIEEQGPTMGPLGEPAGNLAPKEVKQQGLNVSYQGLNYSQVLEVGSILEALDPSVKLISMKIQPSKKFSDYYDASFQLASFSIDVGTLPTPGAADKTGSKSKRRGSSKRSKKSSSRRSKRGSSKSQ